jgi:hypothetical protein
LITEFFTQRKGREAVAGARKRFSHAGVRRVYHEGTKTRKKYEEKLTTEGTESTEEVTEEKNWS